ncbi:putative DD34D transposase [Trichonephila clavipes]|nr:putative DD34D transposase [Trichonephila clavipes]
MTRLKHPPFGIEVRRDAARSLQGRLHFKITVWEVAQGVQEGPGGGRRRTRSRRPTTARTEENVDRVREVLRTDRRLSIQQIADILHMSTLAVHGVVTEDLQMRKVCAKLVPKGLTQDQKELRVLRCQELLDLIQNEPDILNSVVTGDEFWMFEYDPELKRQSCEWHTKSSPRPKKARMSKSCIKTMIIVFFDIQGIVHCEFVSQGQTVNSAFYLEVAQEIETPDRARDG